MESTFYFGILFLTWGFLSNFRGNTEESRLFRRETALHCEGARAEWRPFRPHGRHAGRPDATVYFRETIWPINLRFGHHGGVFALCVECGLAYRLPRGNYFVCLSGPTEWPLGGADRDRLWRIRSYKVWKIALSKHTDTKFSFFIVFQNSHHLKKHSIDSSLVGRLIDWFIELFNLSIDWLIGWLVDWSVYRLIGWLIDWLIDCEWWPIFLQILARRSTDKLPSGIRLRDPASGFACVSLDHEQRTGAAHCRGTSGHDEYPHGRRRWYQLQSQPDNLPGAREWWLPVVSVVFLSRFQDGDTKRQKTPVGRR